VDKQQTPTGLYPTEKRLCEYDYESDRGISLHLYSILITHHNLPTPSVRLPTNDIIIRRVANNGM